MENALRATPYDVREQCDRQLKDLQEAYGEAMLEIRARESWLRCWERTRADALGHQGLKDAGFAVPMTKLYQWFVVARRTTCCKPTRSPAKVKPELAEPIEGMI